MDCESDAEHSSMGSLVHIRASEGFPKKPQQTDDGNVPVPFTLLCGEFVEFSGRTTEGVIALTNYRLFAQFKHYFYNIPLGLIESIECREIFFLYIFSKDAKTYRCTFSTNDLCVEWHKKLSIATSGPKRLEDLFAFAYFAWCLEEGQTEMLSTTPESSKSMFQEEVERMGFDLASTWRISKVNEDYSLCSSYPTEILVPATIEDKVLVKLALFRSSKRIPSVVWRHRGNGCVIARCSQPEMGWMGWRNSDDEKLVQDIGIACSFNGGTNSTREELISTVPNENPAAELQMVRSQAPIRTLILDARSYAAAFTNRAKGGGYECQEYYPNCEIQFMSLANIHSIRKSFQSLRTACAVFIEQPNWLSVLENTKWLQHISGLLKAALMVVNAIDREERPVVVHCSDGWDRTSQIVGLAELMLDPYYRTMRGFQVLVEKEWLEFGHKFGDRCGHGLQADDVNERCPVFLQWLDCVHQLLNQFPVSFEFNNSCLIKLIQHTYSCLFGTFLCNNSQERKKQQLHKRTFSVWTYLQNNDSRFKNFLYVKNDSVLRPSWQVRDLEFWSAVYVQNADPKDASGTFAESSGVPPTLDAEETTENKSLSSSTKESLEEENDVGSGQPLVKTRSCTDLQSVTDYAGLCLPTGRQRRLSDPRNVFDGLRGSIEVLANRHADDEESESVNESTRLVPSPCIELKFREQTVYMTNDFRCEDDASISDAPATNGDVNKDVEGVQVSENEEYSEAVAADTANILETQKTKVIETSTDTLVGELASEIKAENNLENNELRSLCNSVLKQEGNAHISTSTTDISDSRVGNVCCVANNGVLMPRQKLLHHCSAPLNLPNGNMCHAHLPPSNAAGLDPTNLNGHMSCPPVVSFATLGSQFPKCICPNGNGLMIGTKQKRVMTMDSNIETLKQQTCSNISSVGNGIRSPGSNIITPFHSRTPSSGFPATPSEERTAEVYPTRFNSTSTSSSSNTAPTITTPLAALVERKIDVDGLSMVHDEVQQRLYSMIAEHQSRVNQLTQMLSMAQLAMCQQVCQRCNGHSKGGAEFLDEVGSQPDSVGSYGSEHYSVGHDSTAASDLSWETVDEQETRPTLWEPDHVVNRCPSCDHEFCLIRRKHHCRCCGRIFCSECSNQEMPVPNEQLYDPVRVCSQCYRDLRCRQQQQILLDPRFPKAIFAATPGSLN